MSVILSFLSGKKTYMVAAAGVLYAISGVIVGEMEASEALKWIQDSGAFATLRAAVAKSSA